MPHQTECLGAPPTGCFHWHPLPNFPLFCHAPCAGGELLQHIAAKGRYREKDAAHLMRTILQVRFPLPQHCGARGAACTARLAHVVCGGVRGVGVLRGSLSPPGCFITGAQ